MSSLLAHHLPRAQRSSPRRKSTNSEQSTIQHVEENQIERRPEIPHGVARPQQSVHLLAAREDLRPHEGVLLAIEQPHRRRCNSTRTHHVNHSLSLSLCFSLCLLLCAS